MPRTMSIWRLLLSLTAVLTGLAQSTLGAGEAQKRLNTSALEDQWFGVGFDFTPAYGAAAVSFANGSNIPLARIEGGEEWGDVMSNLSLVEEWKPKWEYVPVLTDMIRSLASAAESSLGQPIVAASASMPATETVCHQWNPVIDQLIKESFARAGVKYVQIVLHTAGGEPLIYPENSVLAGHGLGLCQPYTRNTSCLRDGTQPQLTSESYYFAGYYANALEVITTSQVTTAYGVWLYPFVNYNVGAEMRHRNPDETLYWEEVRRHLSMPLIKFAHRKPSRVILYGDRSGDERFKRAVMEVLKAFLTEEEMPQWIDDGVNATFSGAMGAAEFAKRRPFWNDEHLPPASLHFSDPKVDL